MRGGRPTVLVTGAGGVYGDATVQSLRRASLETFVIGADIDWHAPGSLTSDKVVVLPRVSDPSYVDALARAVRENDVDLAFIASGTEIKALAPKRDELERDTGAIFILPSAELYALASDKLTTSRFLEQHGFAFPPTVSSLDKAAASALPLPLMGKPRFGQGSRGLVVCKTPADVEQILALEEEYVLQELLGDEDHEYTVGVVATEQGEVLASIALRRWLKGGQTSAAEVANVPSILDYAERLAAKLAPRGYVNVQLRMRGDQPVAFEINARVSSSSGFRTLAGVNEPELIVRKYLLGETPPRPTPKPLAMVRGLDQRVVDPDVWRAAVPKES